MYSKFFEKSGSCSWSVKYMLLRVKERERERERERQRQREVEEISSKLEDRIKVADSC